MSIQTDVLIIGGGFAGVSAAQVLEKQGIKTILIDKKDYFEVTFATLRDISDPAQTNNKARKKYTSFLIGDFIQGTVMEMTENHALISGDQKIEFKQALIASGTRYPSLPLAKTNSAMELQSRNRELNHSHQELKSAKKVLIIGGGIVGVELAGEIAYSMPNIQLTLAHNHNELLNGFKTKAQKESLKQLTDLGVKVVFNSRYKKVNEQYVDENTGHISDADLVFQATGVVANNEFIKAKMSHILNQYGYVKIDKGLQVIGYDNLYALGDIADVGEAKLGYLAREQGVYVAKSIIKQYKGKTTKGYKRNPLMALIPIGQKRGLMQLPFAVTTLKMLINLKQKDLFISKMYKSFGTSPN